MTRICGMLLACMLFIPSHVLAQNGLKISGEKKQESLPSTLIITSNPKEIVVSIPALDVKSTKGMNEWKAEGIQPGSYSIEFSYNNHTIKYQLSLDGDETVSLHVDLEEGIIDRNTPSKIVITQSGSEQAPPPVEDNNKNFMIDPRDGQTYKVVEIGQSKWMAQNLNFKGVPSWVYDDNESNGEVYGRVYQWEVAGEACPDGWHLPSIEEWQNMSNVAKNSVTLKSTSGWYKNKNGTDQFGFNGVPSGFKQWGKYKGLGKSANYWTSTVPKDTFVGESENAHYVNLSFTNDDISIFADKKNRGYSIRCVAKE